MAFPAIYAIVVGLAMIVQWSVSYFTRQIPELASEPIRIGFHLAGEMMTAITLVMSGIGLLVGTPWAGAVFLISMGMLFYTAVVSPGYFAQKGQWIWLLIFGVMILVGILAIIAVLYS